METIRGREGSSPLTAQWTGQTTRLKEALLLWNGIFLPLPLCWTYCCPLRIVFSRKSHHWIIGFATGTQLFHNVVVNRGPRICRWDCIDHVSQQTVKHSLASMPSEIFLSRVCLNPLMKQSLSAHAKQPTERKACCVPALKWCSVQ